MTEPKVCPVCGKGQYKYGDGLYTHYTCRHMWEKPLNYGSKESTPEPVTQREEPVTAGFSDQQMAELVGLLNKAQLDEMVTARITRELLLQVIRELSRLRAVEAAVSKESIAEAVWKVLATYRCRYSTDIAGGGAFLSDKLLPHDRGKASDEYFIIGVREAKLLAGALVDALAALQRGEGGKDGD